MRILATLSLIATSWTVPALAQLKPEPLVGSDLPAKPGPHWVWVNDVVFPHMADGKAFLVDGDSGDMRGMLSTGHSFNGVVTTRNRSAILSPEAYFTRGTRGKRTDVVTIYDPRKLAPLAEVVARRLRRPARAYVTCRPTRPISTRLSSPLPSSRRCCGPPPPEPCQSCGMHSRTPSMPFRRASAAATSPLPATMHSDRKML
jgi:hypothetical protein